MTKDLHRLVGRRLLVQLPGLTFDGTLTRAGRDVLELEHVQVTEEGNAQVVAQPVDGLVVIPAAQILWVQVP